MSYTEMDHAAWVEENIAAARRAVVQAIEAGDVKLAQERCAQARQYLASAREKAAKLGDGADVQALVDRIAAEVGRAEAALGAAESSVEAAG